MAYLVKPFQADLLPAIEMTSRFARSRLSREEVSTLQDRLETRKLVERPALMTVHTMTEPEAFSWIQRAAMDKTHHDESRRRARHRDQWRALNLTDRSRAGFGMDAVASPHVFWM